MASRICTYLKHLHWYSFLNQQNQVSPCTGWQRLYDQHRAVPSRRYWGWIYLQSLVKTPETGVFDADEEAEMDQARRQLRQSSFSIFYIICMIFNIFRSSWQTWLQAPPLGTLPRQIRSNSTSPIIPNQFCHDTYREGSLVGSGNFQLAWGADRLCDRLRQGIPCVVPSAWVVEACDAAALDSLPAAGRSAQAAFLPYLFICLSHPIPSHPILNILCIHMYPMYPMYHVSYSFSCIFCRSSQWVWMALIGHLPPKQRRWEPKHGKWVHLSTCHLKREKGS